MTKLGFAVDCAIALLPIKFVFWRESLDETSLYTVICLMKELLLISLNTESAKNEFTETARCGIRFCSGLCGCAIVDKILISAEVNFWHFPLHNHIFYE